MNVNQATAAISWSVDLAGYMANLSGVPTAVLTSQFGQYGTLSWLAYGESVAQLEAAERKRTEIQDSSSASATRRDSSCPVPA